MRPAYTNQDAKAALSRILPPRTPCSKNKVHPLPASDALTQPSANSASQAQKSSPKIRAGKKDPQPWKDRRRSDARHRARTSEAHWSPVKTADTNCAPPCTQHRALPRRRYVRHTDRSGGEKDQQGISAKNNCLERRSSEKGVQPAARRGHGYGQRQAFRKQNPARSIGYSPQQTTPRQAPRWRARHVSQGRDTQVVVSRVGLRIMP